MPSTASLSSSRSSRHRHGASSSPSSSRGKRIGDGRSTSKKVPSINTPIATPRNKAYPGPHGSTTAVVTPPPSSSSNVYNTLATTTSWEDYEEGLYAAANKNRRKEYGASSPSNFSGRTTLTSASTSFDDDEDMPMDELMASSSRSSHLRLSNSNTMHSNVSSPSRSVVSGKSATAASGGGGGGGASNRSVEVTDVLPNPMEGDTAATSSSSNVNRIIQALQQPNWERPENLSLEERMLWDSIQTALAATAKRAKESVVTPSSSSSQPPSTTTVVSPRESQLQEQLTESKAQLDQLQQQLQKLQQQQQPAASVDAPSSTSPQTLLRLEQLQEQLNEATAELKNKEEEHDSQVRAIQRVLAEMTTEHEEELQRLNDTISTLSTKVQVLEKEKQDAWNSMGRSAPSAAAAALPVNAASENTKDKHNDKDIGKKDQEIEQLTATIREMEAEKAAFKKEIDRKSRRLMVLERDYKVAKVQLKKAEEGQKQLQQHPPTHRNKNVVPPPPPPPPANNNNRQMEALKAEIETLKERNRKLSAELENAEKERKSRRKPLGSMTPPRPESTGNTDSESVSSAISAEEVETLQKNLSDTSSSLENAKKIIASLENANGSMAVDLRAKLKAKEEELATVQAESADRKRRLDSLATELRDLQKKHDEVHRLEKQSAAQIVRHKALVGLLEKSISGLQSAAVVHEVSSATGLPDTANIDQVAEILSDAMIGIRTSLELSEQFIDEFDDTSTVAMTDVDLSSEVGRQIDAIIKNDREILAQSMKDELEQKRIAVRRLEEALKKQNDEIKRLRTEQQTSGDNQKLMEEIKSLREQCSTNLEVLAKKERELSVLRSSLKVDENDAGYISDDASDADDDDDDNDNNNHQSSNDSDGVSPNGLNGYSPVDSEALATLMAAGGNVSGGQGLTNELVKALGEKEKASKELQAERESLANAKLIISSLEKANKSMMEDLRSRLHDSNTAIASLLDKSMEHEKNSKTLQAQVEKLKKEKEALEREHQTELQKLKNETKVYSLRVASKDMELSDLRRGSDVKTTPEEKKEEEEE